ncbi:hypothetical protein [Erythrobacter sp. YT30]|nr:hypothetical protein [Erythrobacter sp. YT30]
MSLVTRARARSEWQDRACENEREAAGQYDYAACDIGWLDRGGCDGRA